MKIGVFIDLFRPFVLGGAEKNCYEVCKRLVGENEIKVFTCRLKGEEKREEIEGIKIYRVGLPHSLERREVILILPYLFISILYGLKEEFEILYGNGFAGALAAGIVSLLKRKPLVLMLHDVYWDRWGEVIGFSLPGKLLEKLISKLPFFKVITVSDKVRKKLTGILRIPKNKIEVIPDGIDLKLIDSIKTKRKDNSILCVSRLVNYKNVDHVIKAFAKAKKVSPNLELRRVVISSTAELVYVMHNILDGSTFSSLTSLMISSIMLSVLPVPGPALTSTPFITPFMIRLCTLSFLNICF